MRTARPTTADAGAYSAVGFVLLGGLLVSIAVMMLGLVIAAIDRTASTAQVLPLDQVLPRLGRGDPAAILDSGILLLFATPLVGVLVALIAFLHRRDAVFSWVTALLLVMLVIAFGVALH